MIKRNLAKELTGVLYLRMINDRISEFKDYILEIEQKFENDRKRINSTLDESGELDSRMIEAYLEDMATIENVFLRTFRYSIVVSMYSFLEISMNSFCKKPYVKDSSLDLEDIQGQGIKRSQIYLEKVCKLNINSQDSAWQNLLKFNSIRNCIVHAEGDVNKANSTQKIRRIIDQESNLGFEGNRYVAVSKEYIDEVIGYVSVFLNKLHEEAFKK